MKIKRIELKDFKGIHEQTYTANEIERMVKPNGYGKTTVLTAILWNLFDKDYDLNSNPPIRPNTEKENEFLPTVTLICDVDGKEVMLSKMQKKTVGKPNSEGISKVTLSNTYEINCVPKNEKDYKAYLEELGFNYDRMLVCMHPDVFTSKKANDMRTILFEMTSEKSDLDIAVDSGLNQLAELLKSYKATEVEAMHKATKKKADEQTKSIPDIIVGMEKSKVVIDKASLNKKKAELESILAGHNAKIEEIQKSVDTTEKSNEIMQLQFDKNAILSEKSVELNKSKVTAQEAEFEANTKLQRNTRKIADLEAKKKYDSELHATVSKAISELNEQYKKEESKKFDATPYQVKKTDKVCKTCGREFDADKLAEIIANAKKNCEKAKNNFESAKKSEMDRLVKIGKAKMADKKSLETDMENIKSDIEVLQLQKAELEQIYNNAKSALDALPKEIDLSNDEKFADICKKIVTLEAELATAKDVSEDIKMVENAKYDTEKELESVNAELSKESHNITIDKQIEEQRAELRQQEQNKADAERILDQLDELSKRKNELLVAEINSHFSVVTWKLFESFKNGEYKEVCIPMIDGFEFGRSTNTGREILAKIDICNSLQKFYGMNLPILLDGAESLQECNYPTIDSQLLTMVVGD